MKKKLSISLLFVLLIVSSFDFAFAVSSGEDLEAALSSTAVEPAYSQYETDENSVVTKLREAMVNRENQITVYYRSKSVPDDNLVSEWIEMALEETASPVEGDYLRFAYDGSSYHVKYGTYGGDYYSAVTFGISYFTTQEQEQELTAEIERVLAGFNFTASTSSYKKIETIYNYICDNITYDNENLYNSDYKLKYTAYAALINKTAVCQGYSTLLYRMLKEAGIDSRIITGNGNGDLHSWNIVCLDGLYYYLDSTWDAGYDWYNYFLSGSSSFPDHDSDSQYLETAFTNSYPISKQNYVSPEDRIITSGDFKYQVNNGKAILVKYSGSSKEVTVPSSIEGAKVTTIGTYAFQNCASLEKLTVSEGITTFEQESIYDCQSLKELVLPASLHISAEGGMMFTGITCFPQRCPNLATIIIASGNESITVVDGVMFNKSLTSLLYYPPGKTDAEYTIPEGITSIGSSSFEGNSHLTKVTMPDTVTSIGYWAFSDSEQLKIINISKNCSSICQFAFSHTAIESLELPAALKNFDFYYSYFPNLKEWVVDSSNEVFSSDQGVLLDKNRKTVYLIPEAKAGEYMVPDTVTHINARAARDIKLSKITIPASATIGNDNFLAYPDDLTIYGYEDSNAQHLAVDKGIQFISLGEFESVELASGSCGDAMTWSVNNKGVLRITGSGTMSWSEDAIPWKDYNNQINKVVIDPGPEDIKDYAFAEMGALSAVSIPGSVKKIGYGAFRDCENIKSVEFSEGIEEIGIEAFRFCHLKNLYLPASLRLIGEGAFDWCSLETISVHPDNKYYTSKDNVLFSKDGRELILYPQSAGSKVYYVPDGVETIGVRAFSHANLRAVYCSDSVKTIEKWAFSDSYIRHIDFGNGIKLICSEALLSSQSIDTMVIGKSLETIEHRAFDGVYSLKKVYYKGTDGEWNKTNIASYNPSLFSADIECICNDDLCGKNVHRFVLMKPYKEATETENGNVEYYKCAACGKLFSWIFDNDDVSSWETTEEDVVIPAYGIPVEDPSEDPSSGPSADPYDDPPVDPSGDASGDPSGDGSGDQIGPIDEDPLEDLSDSAEIKLSQASFTYKYKVKTVNGKKKAVAVVQKPAVTVLYDGETLNDYYYDLIWSNSKSSKIGEYKVTVNFIGGFSGKAEASYTIIPKGVSLKTVKAGKKKYTASWKKLSAKDIKYKVITGYQIRYAAKADFSDAKIIKAGTLKSVKKTVNKLKARKKYYVQLRTYKTVNGKKYFSRWSRTKKVKTK